MSSWLLQTLVEDSGRLRPVAFKSAGWTRVLKEAAETKLQEVAGGLARL